MNTAPLPIEIPRHVLEEVYKEARISFPLECCGWLAGNRSDSEVKTVRKCLNAQESGGHPTADDRGGETAYVISGEDLLELNRSLDSEMPARIIYHSHPNGQAYFSDIDKKVATSPWGDGPAYPVQQLVIGIDDKRVVESILFAWSEEKNKFVKVKEFLGADI